MVQGEAGVGLCEGRVLLDGQPVESACLPVVLRLAGQEMVLGIEKIAVGGQIAGIAPGQVAALGLTDAQRQLVDHAATDLRLHIE